MDRLYFPDYGALDWLEPKDFYAGSWSCYDTSKGEDGVMYEIVKAHSGELRYTII